MVTDPRWVLVRWETAHLESPLGTMVMPPEDPSKATELAEHRLLREVGPLASFDAQTEVAMVWRGIVLAEGIRM